MTSQPNPKPRPGLAVVLVLVSLLACKDKMCEPKPLPEPWKPHAALIPDNTVICGNNRGPSDNYPPTQLFIYYKGRDTATAYEETIKKFAADGWALADHHMLGEGSNKTWIAKFSKGGTAVRLTVNKNDFGIQGSFEMTK